MKKNVKTIAIVMLSILMLWCGCLSAYASDADTGVVPCLDNAYNFAMSFAVIDPGVAEFVVSYNGDPNTFMVAKLTVTFEKRYLGVFWRTVDIGWENNEWVGRNADLQGEFFDSITMNGTGTYRANFTLTIYGPDTADVIEESIVCNYN